VGALRRLALPGLVAALAALLVAGLVVAGRDAGTPGIAPPGRLVVRTRLEPAAAAFCDRVVAHVVVLLDRTAVRAGTLKITPDLVPLTQLGPAAMTRTRRGQTELVSLEIPVACLTEPCVRGKEETAILLPRVSAAVTARDGRVFQARTSWPELLVASRVSDADLAPLRPPFRGDTAPPPVSYAVAPTTLSRLLVIAAALLAAAGLALAASAVARLARRRKPVAGELELALRLAREAEARPAPDRRRALGLVARVLRQGRLADQARELAWAEPKPDPRALSELVAEIERQVAT
jgi:hypothetical protein